MLYVINYVKDNGFFKAAKRKPELKTVNKEGEITSETVYKRPSIPGGRRNYTPSINYSNNRVRILLEQGELNKLVKEMEIYDKLGNQITHAPIGNPAAPFWVHESINLTLESASHTLNDELPMDRFWLECMKADPKFFFKDGQGLNSTVHSMIVYEVIPINMQEDDAQKGASESMEAVELLEAMGDEKKRRILKGLGVHVGEKQDTSLIHKTLFSKITFEKDDLVRGSHERYIDRFMTLAKSSSATLTVIELFADARRKQVIYKDRNGNFKYGDLVLGRSEQEVYNYLEDTDNDDIIVGITEAVHKQ